MGNYLSLLDELLDADDAVLLATLLQRRRMQIKTRNDVNTISLPSPEQSSWQYLYKNGDDQSFINIIGINKSTFKMLLKLFSLHYKHKYHLGKGGRPSKLSTSQTLGMLLQFYASTSEMKSIAQLHGLRKNLASKIIRRAEASLSLALRNINIAKIKWPSKLLLQKWAGKINQKHNLIFKVLSVNLGT